MWPGSIVGRRQRLDAAVGQARCGGHCRLLPGTLASCHQVVVADEGRVENEGKLGDEGRLGQDPFWRVDVVVMARSVAVLVQMRY